MEVVKRRVKEREEVVERAREYALSLKGRYSVFLVGSYARGDFNVWSDVDLVVIGEFEGGVLERLEELEAPPRFEVIPLTPAEALRGAEKGNPLMVELVEKGLTLRDDFRIRDALRERLSCRRGKSPSCKG
ncbi:MAG: nucleotidyltransferase domain-containing protein [Thermofilaceae archaeon]